MERVHTFLEAAQRAVLDLVPKSRHEQLLLAGGSITVASAVLYPVILHYTLGKKVSHTRPNASSRAASVECKEIDSFPTDLIEHPKKYRISHDKVVKYLRSINVTLSNKNEELFNKVLRRNMTTFSKTLSGLLLWYGVKSLRLRSTFDKDYIENLNFKEGDLVCGIYEVVKRTPLRVEFKLNHLKSVGPIEGLLIVSIRPRNEGGVLTSETVQWTKKDTGAKLPLEGVLIWFIHSLVSRYITVTGAQYLEQIAV